MTDKSELPFTSPFSKDEFLTTIGKTAANLLGGGVASGDGDGNQKATATARSLKFDPDAFVSTPALKTQEEPPKEPVSHGVALVYVQDKRAICGSVIGAGKEKFCLNLACDCTTASHKKASKLPPDTPDAFLAVKSPKSNAAFVAPVIDAARLSAVKIGNLLIQDEPEAGSWAIEFQALALDMEADEVSKLVAQTVRKAPRFSQVESSVGFLGAKDIGLMVDACEAGKVKMEQSMWATGGGSATLERESLEGVWSILDAWSDGLHLLTKSSEGTADRVYKMATGLEGTIPPLAGSISTLQEQCRGMWAAINSLENAIGPVTNQEVGTGLWSSFKAFEENSTLMLNTSKERLATLQATVRNQSAQLASVISGSAALKADVMDVLRDHTSALVALNDRMSSKPAPQPRVNPFAALKVTGYHDRNQQGPVLENQGGGEEIRKLTALVDNLQDRLNKMEALGVQSKGPNGEAIELVGQGEFRNIDDTRGWVTSNIGADLTEFDFGVFTDPLSLLHRINHALTGSSFTLKEIGLMEKMDMTEGEHLAMNSLQHGIPKVFTGDMSRDKIFTGPTSNYNNKGPKTGEARFKNVMSYAHWEDTSRQHGLKVQILNQLAIVRQGVEADMATHLHDKPEAKALATSLLSKSVSFIEHLCTYMSESYREINKSPGTAVQSWDLICFVVTTIFVDAFGKARKTVGSAVHNPSKRLKFGSYLILSAVRSTEVAVVLQSTGLENHPVVSGAYTKFILKSVNAGEIRDLKDQVAVVSSQVVEAASSADVAKRNADSALSTAKAAKAAADRAAAAAKKGG